VEPVTEPEIEPSITIALLPHFAHIAEDAKQTSSKKIHFFILASIALLAGDPCQKLKQSFSSL
jgi:hypothetical protein